MLLKFLIRSHTHTLCPCLFRVGYGNDTVAITYLRLSCVCVGGGVWMCVCVCAVSMCFLDTQTEREGNLSRKGEWNGNGRKMHKVYVCTHFTHPNTLCESSCHKMIQRLAIMSLYRIVAYNVRARVCVCMSVYVCLCASVRFFLRSFVRFVLARFYFPVRSLWHNGLCF